MNGQANAANAPAKAPTPTDVATDGVHGPPMGMKNPATEPENINDRTYTSTQNVMILLLIERALESIKVRLIDKSCGTRLSAVPVEDGAG